MSISNKRIVRFPQQDRPLEKNIFFWIAISFSRFVQKSIPGDKFIKFENYSFKALDNEFKRILLREFVQKPDK